MKPTKRIALLAAATLLFSMPGSSSQRLDEAIKSITAPETQEEAVAEAPLPELEEVVIEPEPRWVGRNFTETEQAVLNFLQDRGITDRAALATILGNIQQESRFNTLVCEGGRNTGYHGCHSGGFGLIQWTTVGRYRGLGSFAAKYGLDPNQLTTQLRYMVNEYQWTSNEHIWKTPGKSINQYMNAAYRWLGWGIHGARTSYAQSYYDALHLVR